MWAHENTENINRTTVVKTKTSSWHTIAPKPIHLHNQNIHPKQGGSTSRMSLFSSSPVQLCIYARLLVLPAFPFCFTSFSGRAFSFVPALPTETLSSEHTTIPNHSSLAHVPNINAPINKLRDNIHEILDMSITTSRSALLNL